MAMQKLSKAQGELDVVSEDLRKMQSDFDGAMAKKQAIQADADATQKRMDSANKLISALGGEYKRWKVDSEAFADELRRMTGDVALACAFVSYAGPFNADFRTSLLENSFFGDCVDKKIPVTKGLSVTKFMVDETTVGDWAHEGLPSDDLSIQNGIMVTLSSKWPLLIDPQNQGLSWSEPLNPDLLSHLCGGSSSSPTSHLLHFWWLLFAHPNSPTSPLLYVWQHLSAHTHSPTSPLHVW